MAKDFVTRGHTGQDKAVNFGLYLKSYGWSGSWTTDDKAGTVQLGAKRGNNEAIEIQWKMSGTFLKGTYVLAGEKFRMHNVAAAAAVASEAPNEDRLKKSVRRQRKKIDHTNPDVVGDMVAVAQCSLPFDGESSDAEIKAVLFNKSITWVNRQTGQINTAIVGGKNFKVVRNGRDYIDFVDGFGFHAVYLDSIVSVG